MNETRIEEAGISDMKPPMVVGVHIDCANQDRREAIQEWGEEILSGAMAAGIDTRDPNFTLLAVSLKQCGSSATYRTVDDIPLVDVSCPCGNPNHWLIKYQEAL